MSVVCLYSSSYISQFFSWCISLVNLKWGYLTRIMTKNENDEKYLRFQAKFTELKNKKQKIAMEHR